MSFVQVSVVPCRCSRLPSGYQRQSGAQYRTPNRGYPRSRHFERAAGTVDGDATAVELVAEIWSPGNRNRERSEKFDSYAQAGIRYFWVVEIGGPVVHAYELRAGRYQIATTLREGTVGTITAAPVPVTFDPADLLAE